MTAGLADRMKAYEAVTDHRLTPNSWVVIRVDGRAFHTYTRQEFFRDTQPFSGRLQQAMLDAMKATAEGMQGFRLAYTQSDECTFAITDTGSHEDTGWFGYRLAKIQSLAASTFTAHFNYRFSGLHRPRGLATFDARAFVVPEADVPNVFVWRQRDWERNSLSMLAQHHFSHRELQGKNQADMHEMLHGIGVNWAKLPDVDKTGIWFCNDGNQFTGKLDYDKVAARLEKPE